MADLNPKKRTKRFPASRSVWEVYRRKELMFRNLLIKLSPILLWNKSFACKVPVFLNTGMQTQNSVCHTLLSLPQPTVDLAAAICRRGGDVTYIVSCVRTEASDRARGWVHRSERRIEGGYIAALPSSPPSTSSAGERRAEKKLNWISLPPLRNSTSITQIFELSLSFSSSTPIPRSLSLSF